MDQVALFNRSFWDVTAQARPAYDRPDTLIGSPHVPRQPVTGSVQGFHFFPKALRPIDLYAKPGQDFENYATEWEKQYSVLLTDRTPAEMSPVVGHDAGLGGFPVVAHFGMVHEDWIVIPKKYETALLRVDTKSKVRWMLNQGIPAYVEFQYPNAGDWGPLSRGYVYSYRVLTDLEGQILTDLGMSTRDDSIEAADPFLYLGIGTLLVKLAASGTRLILAMMSRAGGEAATEAVSGGEIVAQLRREGKPIVVNMGGTGEVPNAINLNPNIVAPRIGIPNLIKQEAEEIGEIFEPNSVDGIVSNSLPPNTLDWKKVLPGAQRVLKPGRSITIRFTGIGEDAKTILTLLKNLGFKNITDFMNKGVAITATKS